MTAKRITHRETILDAANRLAIRAGVSAMTIEAVAVEAGISKGGVLYHFPSKEKLIAGLLVHFMDKVEAEVVRHYAADLHPTGRWLRSFLRIGSNHTGVEPPETFLGCEMDAFFNAMLTAAIVQPDLMIGLRGFAAEVHTRLQSDAADPLLATISILAMDGLWLWGRLGLMESTAPLRQTMLREFWRRSYGSSLPGSAQ